MSNVILGRNLIFGRVLTAGTLTAVLIFLHLAGAAQARPDARKMTCDQAQSLVLQHGAIVISTGQYTYQRFVSSRRYCDYWEWTRSAWTATRDNPKCRIGYICEARPDDDDRRGRLRWLNRR